MSELNFDVIKKAGLTQAQFGELLQVSRVAVNSWIHGGFGIHPMRRARVERLLKAMRQAVRDGKLPVDSDDKEKRFSATKRVLVSYLRTP